MKKATKRLRKKYFSKVAKGLKSGQLKAFYFYRARHEISLIFEQRYLTVFRPWWYENFDRWNELSFHDELKVHTEWVCEEIELLTGINYTLYHKFAISLPDKPKRVRKYREPKPQPIRKLKNPEEFVITRPDRSKATVIGEKVFSYNGYDFFIRHEGSWIVSDVAAGAIISQSTNYNEAVWLAKERMEKHFDKYLEQVNHINGGAA